MMVFAMSEAMSVFLALFLLLLFPTLCGFLVSKYAEYRGGRPGPAFWWGFFANILGLIVVHFTERARCPHCREPVSPSATICPHCRTELAPDEARETPA